jgi:2-oxoglutarate dehydrogenase E2 component (dihydrolipoamide succinyltransferase)
MSTELKVPHVGESIYEVTIGEWFKQAGDYVNQDEPIVALETDKASLDVGAPVSGTLTKVLKHVGDSAQVGEVLALIDESAAPASSSAPAAGSDPGAVTMVDRPGSGSELRVMPAAKRLLEERGLRPQDITPTGPGGRLLKEDVLRHIDMPLVADSTATPRPAPSRALTQAAPFTPKGLLATPAPSSPKSGGGNRETEVVAMTPMRRRIAKRLVESQQTAALLTTFNEVDMTATMALRKQYKEEFIERHGTKLGFMSFFVKATIEALKDQPALNASVDGDSIVYHHYYDIGVAVGGGKGLVVPVIRNAERMSFAEVEMQIRDFGIRAKKNKIRPDELQGGTFTISNGGVYGSLMSTPIVNPPQSGILGMHNIVQRAVVIDGQIVARPMMYIALTYDHRLVDGREAVTFLKRIKECVENPSRILLEV